MREYARGMGTVTVGSVASSKGILCGSPLSQSALGSLQESMSTPLVRCCIKRMPPLSPNSSAKWENSTALWIEPSLAPLCAACIAHSKQSSTGKEPSCKDRKREKLLRPTGIDVRIIAAHLLSNMKDKSKRVPNSFKCKRLIYLGPFRLLTQVVAVRQLQNDHLLFHIESATLYRDVSTSER